MRFKILIPLLILFILVYSFMPKRLERKVVDLSYGTKTIQMALFLYREGVIRSPISFLIIHMIIKGKLEAGEYEFDGLVFPWDVYRKIHYGLRKLYKVTIPEGSDIYDVAYILEMGQICKGEDFLKYALSPQVSKKYGISTYGIEGFLFPDTYYFSKNTHPLRIIDVMFNNFIRRTKDMRSMLEKLDMSPEEWVTIASLIEKETAVKEEKPLVSAVIYNRLKKGMRLQIDPTVIYSLKRKGLWNGKLLSKDLSFDDPYNTYVYFGLPPSPICNPSLDSLWAAVNPSKVDYLYFVADGNGGHKFSSNYKQHVLNVKAYKNGRE